MGLDLFSSQIVQNIQDYSEQCMDNLMKDYTSKSFYKLFLATVHSRK